MKYWCVLIGASSRKVNPSPSLKPSCARRASISWSIRQAMRERWPPHSPL